MSLGIACGSGGYRTVFIHGVLNAFEEADFRADAYAGTSASVLVAAGAAVGKKVQYGVGYWQYGLDLKQTAENGMSDVSLTTIAEQIPILAPHLFAPDAPRFIVPVSAVVTPAGAEETQNPSARRLGRKILLSAARRKRHEWVDGNLQLHVYDTHPDAEFRLTPDNFEAVAYASSRMMHAWDIPATIDGQPYVDASYTCSLPAVELAERGYDHIIAISADPPPTLFRDIFGDRVVPDELNGTIFHGIMPDGDVADMGADFTDATPEGLQAVFEHGEEKGRAFLDGWSH